MAARRVESYLHILLFWAGAGMPGLRRVLDLGAVVAGFGCGLPGIRLKRSEGALEEGIVNDVAFAVLSTDDPVSALDVAKAEVGSDGLVFLALSRVYKQGAAGAK